MSFGWKEENSDSLVNIFLLTIMARKDKQATKEYYNRQQANHYVDYTVDVDMPLMEFLMKAMAGASRTKVKEVLTQRMVYVDKKITTQYN